MTQLIVSYQDAVHLGSAIVGGKGWNLGRLQRYGFLVPEGAILSAHIYTQFMKHPTLNALCAEMASVQPGAVTDAGVEDALQTLRVTIEATELPTEVEQAVQAFLTASGLVDVPVAVRSSATTEDSATASFAGIHESFLHVKGSKDVLQAIKRCYASLWTPRALAYRRHQGFSDETVACAVVICSMVTGPMQSPPVAAGVAFSCDPRTGQRDRVTINAAPGWGDVVVSGHVSPEEIIVISGSNGKPSQIKRAKEHPQVLADAQVMTLASLVQRVLWAISDGQDPQDVEWVYDGQCFWLVQARPATSVPHVCLPAIAALPTIWSNANVKDAVPGVPTPFSWSIISPIISDMLYVPCQAVGYSIPDGMERMRRFSGHGYFDLTTLQWSYCDTFGLLPPDVNRDIGGHQPEIPIPSQHPLRGWKGPRRILARLLLVRAILRRARLFPQDTMRRRARARAQAHISWADCSSSELLVHLQHINEQAGAFGTPYQFANLSKVWADYLAQTLEGACPGQGRTLASALMASSREVESAEYGYQLYEVAIAATNDPAALTYLTTKPFDPQGWQTLPAHSPFRLALASFLDTFGHRSIYELELANPRWSEEPGYLFDCIQALLKQETITVPYAIAREKRLAAEAEVARLPLRIRPLVYWFAKQARLAVSHREAGKSTLVLLLLPLRGIALEVGRRMVTAHILQDRDDIFYLAWPDLIAFLRGEWDGQGAQTLVHDRKEQRNIWLGETPDDVFICDAQGHPTELPATFEMKVIESHGRSSGRNVYGLGASPGQASGRARIIHHPNEGHSLQAGEILVAPSTDPGWTPLFLRASAIVMETGGYLSHGAIVARELGIPAVINIPGLLEIIKDGQYLTVDGDQGHIILGEMCDQKL
jgi:rifampicin phosphotransferase